jgi:hypothetical protein
MYLSRVIFRVVSLSVLLIFLALQTSSGDEKPQYVQVKLKCTTSLNVDPNQGVDQRDIYVCENAKVTWNANGHTFHVFFKNNQCPFQGGCNGISDQHPTSTPVKHFTALTVFDYGIVVDDNVFDPHVVGGGGNS